MWRQRVIELSNKPVLRAVKPVLRATQVVPRRSELRDLPAWRRHAALHRRVRRSGHTLLSSRHGRDLLRLAEDADRRGISGDLVDCGVWNGGSTLLLASGAPTKEVWAFDSFEGLPEPTGADPEYATDWAGEFVGSEAMLRRGFRDYGLENELHIVAGWFAQTLPAAAEQIGSIAVLHVDADLYESVRTVLRTLYSKVSPGGWVAVDDYRIWPGTKLAVDEVRREMGVEAPILDHHYWQKPS